jgi:phosphomannomutase
MTHQFNPTILREYDIRGIVGKTLTEADAYALGRSYAALAREEGARRIAVGRDGRTHSGMLEAALIRGLMEGGIDVMQTGMGPSPMLYFATHYLDVDGGIQVTGSHNPADYNGFKMLLKGRSVFGQEIQALGSRAASGTWSEGKGTTEEVDIREAYVNRLLEGFSGKGYRVGWDAGNGAAGPVLDMLVDQLPGNHHVIFSQVDGTFPNHHPDPTVEKNLADLKELVAREQLDFGIAFDGDGDRIGAVDGEGRVIWGDQLLMILAVPVLQELPGATLIADVKASQSFFDHVAELGGQPLMWKTGHSLIKSKMKETGAPLAGEMSGHIFFKHRWYGFDDALYAAVRLIEAVSASGKSLTEIMDAMPKTTATPELRFQVDFRAMERKSTPPTGCASVLATAGGCSAHPTRRTCWSRGPRRRTSPALIASWRRSTINWRSQESNASKRRTRVAIRGVPGLLSANPDFRQDDVPALLR